MKLSVIAALSLALLAGCVARTVHFDDVSLDQVQTAYEHIFHPPPPPPTPAANGGLVSEIFGSSVLSFSPGDFSEVGEALDTIELIERLFGFWSASIEESWQDGRYKREYSSWWLLIPLHIDSEIATVRQTETGVEFTLELYPADEASFEERFDQLRKNLGIGPGP